jgi:predicted nucleotidyltransferase
MMICSAIGDALFTKTQQRVLGLLYGRPEQTFYLNEIVRLAHVGKGSVSRELEKLCAAGLLTVSRQGNQNHYQANANNPIFNELKAITQKTFGVVDIIKAALVPLLPQLSRAFIYGSVAQGTEHAGSDIDLMLVGDDISYSEVMELLVPAEKQLGRTINPTLYTVAEFTDRKTNHQPFIQRVMEQPKLWLVGDMELKN